MNIYQVIKNLCQFSYPITLKKDKNQKIGGNNMNQEKERKKVIHNIYERVSLTSQENHHHSLRQDISDKKKNKPIMNLQV